MEPAPRPFLKWAGGKRQLLETIDQHLPEGVRDGTITRFVEPFVGGGAVFFHIRQRYYVEEFHISDFNPDLANAYVVIRDALEGLLGALQPIADEYLPLEHEQRAEVFYRTRDEYNASRECLESDEVGEGRVLRAAQTIFLNRTCFNGLYRVNSKGDYNVPHGRYRNPPIRDTENLASVSHALQGVQVSCGSYEICEPHVDSSTFVYLDPPYRPLPNTPSFTDYAQKSTFGDEDQRTLAAFYAEMHERGASLMLSNSDPRNTDPEDGFFDELYAAFGIRRVEAIRAISSDGGGRGAITEILVTNYGVAT
jgi:DNA adenine methylase